MELDFNAPTLAYQPELQVTQDQEYRTLTLEQDSESEPSTSKRIQDVVYEILRFVPIAGTIIGVRDAINAYNWSQEGLNITSWTKAEIITELFSFLIVPQIVYGIACCIDSALDAYNQRKVASAEIVDDLEGQNRNTPTDENPTDGNVNNNRACEENENEIVDMGSTFLPVDTQTI